MLFFDLYILEPKLDFVCDFCMGAKCLNEWVRLVSMYFVLLIDECRVLPWWASAISTDRDSIDLISHSMITHLHAIWLIS